LMNFELTAAVKPFDLYRIVEVRDANPQQVALRQAWLREELKRE
jgi:hypothetical protein